LISKKIKKMVLGVSGWLGDKIGLTEKQVRLLFILAALFLGTGIGLYLILWVVKIVTE
jgi:phage shock protein PspC (stress-responsive transcriptional regulator)